MAKKEIIKKFDDIVAFAGIEKFLDTPVKRYSSGMYVRLAFSVAAHMEPDILIIDEVLAVGDAEFQKKCLGKMDEITKKEGRTILFVSHNMQAIAQLCTKTILLKDGKIKSIGATEKVLKEYSSEFFRKDGGEVSLDKKNGADATFAKVSIRDEKGEIKSSLDYLKSFSVHMELEVKETISKADVHVGLKNSRGFDIVFYSLSDTREGMSEDLAPGLYSFSIKFEGGFILPDEYSVKIILSTGNTAIVDERADAIGFKLFDNSGKRSQNNSIGIINIPNIWSGQKNAKQ